MILIIIAFYAIFTMYSDYTKILVNFSHIQLWYLPGIVLTSFLSILFKSLRQQFLLKTVLINFSLKKNLVIFIASLSFLVTPAASGTFVKTYFIKQKLGIPISRTIPVVLVERYFDVAGILSIISLFLVLRFTDVLLIPTVIIDALLIISVFILRDEKLLNVIIHLVNRFKRLNRLSEFLTTYRSSISSLFSKKTISFVVPFSILCWLMDGITSYLCFLSFGQSIDMLQASLISLSSFVFGFATLIPGGLGVTEVSMVAMLVKQGISVSLASSMVLYIRVCTLWFALFLGLVFTKEALKVEN